MPDLTTQVKAQVLARLEAFAPLDAYMPDSRIFPMQVSANPVYPFIRYGQPTVRPYENGCGSGVDMDMRLHVFAKGETQCEEIAAAVVTCIDQADEFMVCDWVGTQYIPDTEADIWHAVIDYSVTHTV